MGGQLKYIAIKVNGILVGVGWFTWSLYFPATSASPDIVLERLLAELILLLSS